MGVREELAENFNRAAVELEKAAAHCRIAAKRYNSHDVPSGCAHTFASIGHISKANAMITSSAEIHTDFTQINE